MGIHVIPCKYMYLKFPLCLKGLQGVQRRGQRDSWVRGTIFLSSTIVIEKCNFLYSIPLSANHNCTRRKFDFAENILINISCESY